MMNHKSIPYTPGMFDSFKSSPLDGWNEFPDKMWGLGFEMDCEHSFTEYCKTDPYAQSCKEPHSRREEHRNILYILEHAPLKIVGDYLFSHYRYLTHWAYSFDKYDVDFLVRIIGILESKYQE